MSEPFPEKFTALEPFADWAQPTELRRNQKRWSVTLEESRAFYDAMLEAAPKALVYLNETPLDELNPAQKRLLDLCLAFAEVSITIEMYDDPQPKYVFPIDRFVPLHDSWRETIANGAM